jgi:hypothetical protein
MVILCGIGAGHKKKEKERDNRTHKYFIIDLQNLLIHKIKGVSHEVII